MMDAEKVKRELAEEVNVARVQSAIEGDARAVAAMDAMGGRAEKLMAAGKLSALAYMLLGKLAGGRAMDESEEEVKAEYVRLHDGDPKMCESWDRCLDELRGLSLWP